MVVENDMHKRYKEFIIPLRFFLAHLAQRLISPTETGMLTFNSSMTILTKKMIIALNAAKYIIYAKLEFKILKARNSHAAH